MPEKENPPKAPPSTKGLRLTLLLLFLVVCFASFYRIKSKEREAERNLGRPKLTPEQIADLKAKMAERMDPENLEQQLKEQEEHHQELAEKMEWLATIWDSMIEQKRVRLKKMEDNHEDNAKIEKARNELDDLLKKQEQHDVQWAELKERMTRVRKLFEMMKK